MGAQLRAVYKLPPAQWGTEASTIDISAGGVCLRAKEPVDRGLRLFLELSVPGEPRVFLTGEAVWSNQDQQATLEQSEPTYQVGVRITQVAQADYQHIKQYISSRI